MRATHQKFKQGVDRSHGLAKHEHNKTSQINKIHGFIVVQRKKLEWIV